MSLARTRVGVVGGSLGGLTVALLLRDLGCDVTVYERSASALDGRGAGIAVLNETLRYPVERMGAVPEQFCVSTEWIRFIDPDGAVVHEQRYSYRFSSWNRMYRTLLGSIEPARYRLGREVLGAAENSDGSAVNLRFADGSILGADLVVFADGINSAARLHLQPAARPAYAGYVAWRGVVPEERLSESTRRRLGDALTYQQLPHSHILVYPIPGGCGELRAGHRLVNVVWYRNVEADDLASLLTDRNGVSRSVSLPPGAAPVAVVQALRDTARRELAPVLAEVVTRIDEPFVQAVYDIEVDAMAFGRTCLLGDAAFAARPHAAAGTAKAADDGWALAAELERADGDLSTALPRWQERQLALGRALLTRTREIGDSSQFTGALRPGDPRLIFGLRAPGR